MQIFTSLTLHHFYIQIWEDVERLGNYKEIRISSFLNSVFLCHCIPAMLHMLHKTYNVDFKTGSPNGRYDRIHIQYMFYWLILVSCGSNDFFLFSLILEYFFMCHKKHQYQFIRQSCFLNYKNKPTLKCMFSMFLSEFRE